MNFFCPRRVCPERAGHAIIKTHAEGEQQICFLDRIVHPGYPVHSHHSQVQGM